MRKGANLRISAKDFKDLVEQGNDIEFEWPVARKHVIWSGKIHPYADETRPTFPLWEGEPFWSFALLGKNGEPSEQSILDWVKQHGLLRKKEQTRLDKPEGWDGHKNQAHLAAAGQHVVEPAPVRLKDFRAEVRTAYQLLSLYAETRERDGEAVMRRFIEPVDAWPHTPPTPVDRDLEEYQRSFGEEGRNLIREAGGNVESEHLKYGIDIIIRCVNYKLQDLSPMVEWNWWDIPPRGSASLGLVRWWSCPDLLSAMYLQFYLLITEATPIRICANPHCRNPFPATRKDKLFCKRGCRSTGRNYPH